jgi:plasmid stabilization system protein ParE
LSHIHYTPEAEGDLVGIKKYIAEDRGNPVAAVNTVTKITKRVRNLEQFPELGTRLSSIIDIDTDYRFLVSENFLAFYRIDGNDVYIIRILYGRRDYTTILFGEPPQNETG